MKCSRKNCMFKATFVSPENLCSWHWNKWFAEGCVMPDKYFWDEEKHKDWKPNFLEKIHLFYITLKCFLGFPP